MQRVAAIGACGTGAKRAPSDAAKRVAAAMRDGAARDAMRRSSMRPSTIDDASHRGL